MLLSNFPKNSPDFSVIVNCRNSERFLKQCLDSIKNQTHSDYEVIIWDNKSTDRTFEIAFGFSQSDNRFKVFQGETSLKLGEARNKAIQEAQGSFFAFLDSDDLWHPTFLADHLIILKNSEQKIFGVGNVIEINSEFNLEKNTTQKSLTSITEQPRDVFRRLLKGNTVYFSTLVVPRDFFISQAGFNSEFVQAEDYELLLRIAQKMKCYKAGWAYYRIHEANATNSQEDALFVESLQILKPYRKYFWAWISFKLTAARYFLFLNNPTYGQRLDVLRKLNVGIKDLFMGAVILFAVTLKSELLGRKAS
jgi:glycosyltransferase involved in cell wall biosynthesis